MLDLGSSKYDMLQRLSGRFCMACLLRPSSSTALRFLLVREQEGSNALENNKLEMGVTQIHVHYISIADSQTAYLTSSLVLLLFDRPPRCNSSKNSLTAAVVSRYGTFSPRTMQYPYPRNHQPTNMYS